MWKFLNILVAVALVTACGHSRGGNGVMVPLEPVDAAAVEAAGVDPQVLQDLASRPLYTFSEEEVGTYLAYLAEAEPDLRQRVVRLARKNLGQPYALHLLGEFPIETYDPEPLYSLGKSDCVVFAEHTYAMALTSSWPSFFKMLQRIRYEEGEIGVVTRNHFTEADWNRNNNWLVEDVSEEVAGEDVAFYDQTVRKARLFKNRYGIEVDIPDEKLRISYVPNAAVEGVLPKLEEGDFVNVIVGREDGGLWATHVGLIGKSADGTVTTFIHSTPPAVREEPLLAYMQRGIDRIEERKAEGGSYLWGFKFLRLREDARERLRALDGTDEPVIRATGQAVASAGASR